MRILDWYYCDGDLPLTNKERRELRRSAWILWTKSWKSKAIYVTLVFSLLGIVMVMVKYIASNVWQLAYCIGVYTCLWIFVFYILRRVSIAPLGRHILRQRGIDVCNRCGYWLRGLGKDITECPECGWGREAEA